MRKITFSGTRTLPQRMKSHKNYHEVGEYVFLCLCLFLFLYPFLFFFRSSFNFVPCIILSLYKTPYETYPLFITPQHNTTLHPHPHPHPHPLKNPLPQLTLTPPLSPQLLDNALRHLTHNTPPPEPTAPKRPSRRPLDDAQARRAARRRTRRSHAHGAAGSGCVVVCAPADRFAWEFG